MFSYELVKLCDSASNYLKLEVSHKMDSLR